MKEKQKWVEYKGVLRHDLLNLNPKEQIKRVFDIVKNERPWGYRLFEVNRVYKTLKTGEDKPKYILIAYDESRAIAVYPRAYDGDGKRIDSYHVVKNWNSKHVVYSNDIDDNWVVYTAKMWTPIVYTGPGTYNIPDGMIVVQVWDLKTGYPVRYLIRANNRLNIFDINSVYCGKRVAYYTCEKNIYGQLNEGWVELK